MFCYQCEQTSLGKGCLKAGVCGKDNDTANLQDTLINIIKGISKYAVRADKLGYYDKKLDSFIIESLFTTVTNVNFDPETLWLWIDKALEYRKDIKDKYLLKCKENKIEPEILNSVADWQPGKNIAETVEKAVEVSTISRREKYGEDIAGLIDLIVYGLKGTAAYIDHALILDVFDHAVVMQMCSVLDKISEDNLTADELLGLALKTGEINYKAMEMLDKANTSNYGHPIPTHVRISSIKGKAILVSGHDLKDLHELLVQTEGKGINIYTHGEMIPAHGYPELKKFKHLVGNFGGAWQDQVKEFDTFPGAILMTTNCIQKPKATYNDRIFTTGLVQYPGVTHIEHGKFDKLIAAALEAEGFTTEEEEKSILVGFGRNAVMSVADKVINAVKEGKIRHFFLVGGCDGAKSGRNYYTEFTTKLPHDTVILTLACGKYRFNKLDFGDIDGIPRLLDIGQCNDAYSAIQIAIALSNAFNLPVNNLPLSLVLSWYEQKAVAILLTLLYLGINNIRLGPTLPAFVTPVVLNILVEKFNIKPITTADEDIKAILG